MKEPTRMTDGGSIYMKGSGTLVGQSRRFTRAVRIFNETVIREVSRVLLRLVSR